MPRPLPRPVSVALAAAGLGFLAACAGDSATEPGARISPDASRIAELVAALPAWVDNAPSPRAPVNRSPVNLTQAVGNDVLDYRCGVTTKNLVRTYPRLFATGETQRNVFPGALLEGTSVRSGAPVLLPVDRGAVTVRISLPIAQQSLSVPQATATAVSQAVADLQRAAADEQGVRDVVPANMVFELTEASSLNQTFAALDVSLAYANPLKGISAGGNLNTSTSRSVRTNSVVVKFVQEMFTVRVDEDQLRDPAAFFGQGVRAADLEALAAEGRFGDGNVPVYVESVTYGRVLFFSVQSTNVLDVNELKTAMNVAGRAFSGGASLTTRQRQLLSSATYQIVPIGGPQSAATQAIASLDWSKFFVPAAATTAVPIAFTVKTLNGRQTATVHDNVLYDERAACAPPTSYRLDITLTRVERTSGFCLACAYLSRVGGSVLRAGVMGPTTGPRTFSDSRQYSLAPGQKIDLCSEFDTGARCMPFGYPGAVDGNLNNMKLMTDNVERTFTLPVQALGAEGLFTYRVRKRANY